MVRDLCKIVQTITSTLSTPQHLTFMHAVKLLSVSAYVHTCHSTYILLHRSTYSLPSTYVHASCKVQKTTLHCSTLDGVVELGLAWKHYQGLTKNCLLSEGHTVSVVLYSTWSSRRSGVRTYMHMDHPKLHMYICTYLLFKVDCTYSPSSTALCLTSFQFLCCLTYTISLFSLNCVYICIRTYMHT